jgi:hypothetical protein
MEHGHANLTDARQVLVGGFYIESDELSDLST